MVSSSITSEVTNQKIGGSEGRLKSSVSEKLALIQQLKQRSQQAKASTSVYPIATLAERSTRLIDERVRARWMLVLDTCQTFAN
jgi:hypothetical protein